MTSIAEGYKLCIKCGEIKEYSLFSIKSSAKDGLQNTCKSCVSIYDKEYREKNREYVLKKKLEYRENNREDLAAKSRVYAAENKESVAAYKSKYYTDNKEILIAKSRDYRESNKEALTISKAKFYVTHKEAIAITHKEYYVANRDAILARAREYHKTPIGKLVKKNSEHKRRAVIKEGSVTLEELQQLVHDGTNCIYCNCEVTDSNRHIDHFMPLSKGGLHDISNLVITCSTCNLKKYNKMPEVFLNTLPKVDQERIRTILGLDTEHVMSVTETHPEHTNTV